MHTMLASWEYALQRTEKEIFKITAPNRSMPLEGRASKVLLFLFRKYFVSRDMATFAALDAFGRRLLGTAPALAIASQVCVSGNFLQHPRELFAGHGLE